jgi:FtsP/CotA-like multicopper oxidase with cupredoxin domain/ABC-type lipoprotein export system ATPase subunit
MISLVKVSKEYRLDDTTSITPINSIDLEVKPGEFLMIVGRSGSGKTTLLNLCAGLIKPTAGQVLIDGADIQSMNDKELSGLRSKKMGFIFQFQSMLPNLTAIENVAIPASAARNAKEDSLRRAAELLEMVGLRDKMNAFPRQLSAGQLRRVAVARALMNRPEILLADEPTADLDEQTEASIVSILQKIHQSGVTVVMISHNLEFVKYASRALKVENGKLEPVDIGEYRVRRVTLEPGQPSAEMEREASRLSPQEESFRQVSGKYSPPPKIRKGGLFYSPASMWLSITAVVLAAFILGLVLPGALKGPAAQSQAVASPASPSSAAQTAVSASAAMGGGRSSGTGQYDPTDYSLYGNTGLYSSAMMGVSWPLKIDPAPGSPFSDPTLLQNLSTTPGIFEGKLEAKVADVQLNGTIASLLTYNGTYPGPLIKVKRGDTLKINFVNSLPATTEKNILGYEKNHTNLHTHGLHVSPQEPADNVMLDIAPGQSYNYLYDLAKQPSGTLNFIHAHVHGLAAEQLWGGMLSPLVVEDDTSVLSNYESHIMVLKDITLAGSQPQAHLFMSDFMFGKEGDIVTVNGQVNPVLSIKPGQVQRWQILNGSNARFYRVYLENHLLYLVGTDGGLLDRPYPVSSLLLAPGERAEVLVKAAASSGNYKLVSLPYSRQMGMMGMGAGMSGISMPGLSGGTMGASNMAGTGMSGGVYNRYPYDPNGLYGGMGMNGTGAYGGMYNQYPYNSNAMNGGTGMYGGNGGAYGGYYGGMSGTGATGWCPGMIGTIGMGTYDMSASTQVTLMTVSCGGNTASQDLPATVNPDAKRLNMDINPLPKRMLVFGMDMEGRGYINGQNFDVQPFVINSELGTYEVWQINNQTMMDHPFHLHLNAFQVLSVIGGDIDYARLYTSIPALKDTVIVPKMGSVTLLVPVKDYSGTAMFHCHILEHEDIGMMGEWQIGDAGTSISK